MVARCRGNSYLGHWPLRERQLDRKGCAVAGLAFDKHFSSVRIDDMFDDG